MKYSSRSRSWRPWVGALFLCLAYGSVIAQTPPRAGEQAEPLLRQQTSLVTVNVNVMDQFHRQISGLNRDHFEVYENNVRQQIEFFSDIDRPLSIGILFDLSGSMRPKLARARKALQGFVSSSHEEDDFFLVGFNQTAHLLASFSNGDSVLNKLTFAEAQGQTALLDAAYLGIEKMKEGRYDRRALLLISDGQDNSSRYSYGELRKLLKESDVQIYCLGIAEEGDLTGSILDQQGRDVLKELAETTGGLAFFPRSWPELEDAITRIALVLRHQYSLGYVPLNEKRDGKWRKIKIRLNAPKSLPSLYVRAKEGYYAQP
jgi:Ca-activated chloride channel family protein